MSISKQTILNLDQKDFIIGHIYIIRNLINNRVYIGQTVSHRLNKNKFRLFGYIGRFNDHISEALNNKKKNQCTYLNSAIRKYGKNNFCVDIVEICSKDELDSKEIYYINKYNSIYPNGYNLTVGGKNFTNNKYVNNDVNSIIISTEPNKRGRNFGYVHKENTIIKMKEYYKEKQNDIEFLNKKKNTMSESISKFCENKKINILSKLNLEYPLEQYIKPVYKKDTNFIHDYVIRIDKKKFKIASDIDLNTKCLRFKKILEISYEKSKKYNDIPKG